MPTRKPDSSFATPEEIIPASREIRFSVILEGELPEEYVLFILFNRHILLDSKWQNKISLKNNVLPVDLNEPSHHQLIADQPLMFLLRVVGSKTTKEVDPLLHENNRAGANIDLFPLVLGAESINVTVPLLSISTGKSMGCSVEINAQSEGILEQNKIPLLMTLVSAHCLPPLKEGTAFLAALGLDEVFESTSVDFGTSLSSLSAATKVFWAKVSTGGYAASTAFNIPQDDVFVPSDLVLHNTPQCKSVYWKSMRRILVDPSLLRCRLSSPIFIDVAGVPVVGKTELRCRYMGFIDAKVLLEPGQYGVTISTNLLLYNENELPRCGALLDIPPSSSRTPNIVRNTEIIKDEYGHCAYIVLRFDLMEPLVPKMKTAQLLKNSEILSGEGPSVPVNTFPPEPFPEKPFIDARKLRKDGCALAIHSELSVFTMTTRGVVPMGQSIKRTAASRLMMRVRTMLKQFPPCNCSEIEWQDTVTGQHAATRRAVTASFEPQVPSPHPSAPFAASRCRIAGDTEIAKRHVEALVAATAAEPRSLLSKALNYLDERKDDQARCCLLQALTFQPNNKYLLWLFAGQELRKTPEIKEAAIALNIAVKGDASDGISKTIAWAAVHTLHHFTGNEYAAFVGAKSMRKAYVLHQDWKKFYERWVQNSEEEEIFWIPTAIDSSDPFLIAATFFLCLKCYFFTERLLQCLEKNCSNRGAQHKINNKITADVHYLRAASFLLRRKYNDALEVTKKGIGRFGPCALLLQMQTSCLTCIHGWNIDCEVSFLEADRAGAQQCPVLLLRAAWGSFHTDVGIALQRAARCHKIAPGGHSALLIGRIYAQKGDQFLSERWAATAVKIEPLLADGWAFLATLAMHEGEVDKARALIRTANQAGPISADLMKEIDNLMRKLRIQTLPDVLIKDLCYCDYFE